MISVHFFFRLGFFKNLLYASFQTFGKTLTKASNENDSEKQPPLSGPGPFSLFPSNNTPLPSRRKAGDKISTSI